MDLFFLELLNTEIIQTFYHSRGRKCKPIFVQIAKQVVRLKPNDLRLPARAWKVKLVGEGADDAGGVFDDTITEMCQELESGIVPLLLNSPNASSEVGSNRDRLVEQSIDNQLLSVVSYYYHLQNFFGICTYN